MCFYDVFFPMIKTKINHIVSGPLLFLFLFYLPNQYVVLVYILIDKRYLYIDTKILH